MAGLLGDSSGAQECYAESLALYQEFGDEHGIATTKGRLGEAAMARADYAAARRLLEEALEMHRRLGNLWEVGQTLCCLGIVAQQDGRLDQAEHLYEESFSVWRGLGDRKYTHALNNLGWVAVRRGDPAAARARFEAALKVQQEWGDRWVIPWTLVGLGVAAAEASDDARSRTLLAEGIRRGHEMWARNVVAAGIEGIADLAVGKGHVERAARLYGAAAILDESIPQPPDAPTSRGKRSAVRSVLGEEAFAAAYAAGRAMTLEQAVAYALEETEGGTAAEDGAA
jgi:tetratricopeptide (TPR) repeat protein